MAEDGWGAPRIHAELTKLGFVVSEKTVSRYLPRRPVEPDQVKRWVAFLRNHKDDIAAMDLFTVPTVSLRLLYGFFIIEHGRRRILHFKATCHPTAAGVIQQLRDTFPYDTAPKYLLFDRDSIFSAAVVEFIKAMGTKPVRIYYRSPWQNGTAERWILSCRRRKSRLWQSSWREFPTRSTARQASSAVEWTRKPTSSMRSRRKSPNVSNRIEN